MPFSLRRRRSADAPMPEIVAPEETPTKPALRRGDALSGVESDIQVMRRDTRSAADKVAARIAAGREEAARIVAAATSLDEDIEAVVCENAALEETFEGVRRGSADIRRATDAVARIASEVRERAVEAGANFDQLRRAVAEIESVVGLIAKVARQTNLLALNATIEAERAGEFGRGFAVVAREVKALSVETQRATDEITSNIAAVRGAVQASAATVAGVVGVSEGIDERLSIVGDAVTAQEAAMAAAGTSAGQARRLVEKVVSGAETVKQASGAVAGEFEAINGAAEALFAANDKASHRLMMVLRQNEVGDRRRFDRFPAAIAVVLSGNGRRQQTETIDISEGGLLAANALPEARAGDRLTIEIDGLSTLAGRLVAVSPLGLHIAFDPAEAHLRAALSDLIARVQAGYQPLIDKARATADGIQQRFEAALTRGTISEKALFDTDYRPIEGTNPQQYRTAALDFLEREIADLQEAVVAGDKRVVFCAAVDTNGYLPVHNRVFAQPQRPGEVVWNTANARNRRIFDDRTGLLSGRNTRPFLIQAYRRDMGGGRFVLLKEIAVPITVNGRIWGNLRSAYAL